MFAGKAKGRAIKLAAFGDLFFPQYNRATYSEVVLTRLTIRSGVAAMRFRSIFNKPLYCILCCMSRSKKELRVTEP
ncbi:hypothetical protein SDC9_162774 [bioreactor metagenome]|uniref:Uncharacterized protein n=1 Tax=bioreactor metagenome TaxID=1076179 RepID=A0A645FM17_9ZZZZ